MLDVWVHAFFTPAPPHVEVGAHVSHGALPEEENVVPGLHAIWHTVFAVWMQAVFTPAGSHVEPAAHAAHSSLPDAEKVLPPIHGTGSPLHTVSEPVLHAA